MEHGKINSLGRCNEALLVQEFLDGEQYLIDSVSNNGKHVLVGIWHFKRQFIRESNSIVIDHCRMLPSEGAEQDILVAYMHSVLDVLDIKFGASHGEVILVRSDTSPIGLEPCLVEVGARMCGAKLPYATQLATGLGVHELVADVLINNGRLHEELWSKGYRYNLKKYTYQVALIVTEEARHGGADASDDGALHFDALKQLRSCKGVFTCVERKLDLQVTRDVKSSPGLVFLVHSQQSQCEADLEQIRQYEAGSLYRQC